MRTRPKPTEENPWRDAHAGIKPLPESVLNWKGGDAPHLPVATTSWSVLRRTILKVLVERMIEEGGIYVGSDHLKDHISRVADEITGRGQTLARLDGTRWDRLVVEARELLVRNPLFGAKVEVIMPRQTKGRANIVVTDTNGNHLGAKLPGMDEINMNDDTTSTLEREAEAAGVPIVKSDAVRDKPVREKKAKVFPQCLFTGRTTGGGRFTPGGDAKLKAVLVERFRDQEATIDRPDMRPDLRERFATGDLSTSAGAYNYLIELGWEKFATPGKPKKQTVEDGLGEGNYTVTDENGTLLQRVAKDGDALTWAEENDYEVVESTESGIVVAAINPEDDEDGDEDGDEADEADEDDEA